jgi:5-methyltetrahydrofolate--homocysteine methyltransferase
VIKGNAPQTRELTLKVLQAKVSPETVLKEGLIAAMQEVGDRFEKGEFFVPEMLISARAMKEGMAILKPALQKQGIKALGKVVIGTVKGDLHDIGKNLVAMMLEGAGFEVIDLGTDVSPEKFTQAVKDHSANMVGLSALLTTTMLNMKSIIAALQAAGVREKVKVIIGGAPVTDAYAREVGADGYGQDASHAVRVAKQLLAIS